MRKHRIIINIDDYSDENLKDYLKDVTQTVTTCLEDEYDGLKVIDVKIEDVDEGET